MTIDEIKNFRQLGAKTAGHPEFGHAPGIETTTGPLGQGIANAVGMALAERILNARHGDASSIITPIVIAGDGCLMEGISQEAISLAGHLGLGKLIVLFDDNGISIDGPTSLSTSEDQIARFKASGWSTAAVDGHDQEAVSKAIAAAKADPSKPWLIACQTKIGFGAPTKEGKASSHGSPLGRRRDQGRARADRLAARAVRRAAGRARRVARSRSPWRRETRAAWTARWTKLDAEAREALDDPARAYAGAIAAAIAEMKKAAAADTTQRATRVWSELTLEKLAPACPALIGGSADLTGSNNTKAKSQAVIARGKFAGSYIHYGVREHGMAAAMNGMALHGGLIPYGGTFLVFTDYCRPSIRLSALMGQRVVYVMTHDSIGLGEDGPTHQPVEHLAALRAIPNLNVFRPADGVETAECWALALAAADRPSVLALTRQNVPNLRTTDTAENRSAKGGYVIRDTSGPRDATLIATGSEVGLAVAAADLLAKDGIKAAVVSMPSFELFRAQPAAYRNKVLGTAPRVAVEAGVMQGWHEWLRHKDGFVGMSSFGASAPAAKLFEHFGITPAAVAAKAKALRAALKA